MTYSSNPVPQGGNNSSVLVEALQQFPVEWVLTPVWDKKPSRKNWQTEKLSREQLIKELRTGKWNGYGLVTGELSGGLVALDFDGPSAFEAWREHSGGTEPPVNETVAWTSGKPGRCQILLYVPELEREGLQNRVVIPSAKEKEQLEIRWNNCQSVLPPSSHPDTEGYRWLNGKPDFKKIAECPKWILSLLRKQTSQPTTLDFSTGDVPLIQFLSKQHRDLINSGVTEGGRNDSGAAIARDLIGAANRLPLLGIRFSDSPRQLFDDFCRNCNPPIDSREADQIWKSAERSNPTPALTDEMLENCAKAWLTRENRREQPANSKVVPINPRFSPPAPISDLKREIDALLDQDLRRSELQLKVSELAQKFNRTATEIWKIYKLREEERETEITREDVVKEVERLLAAQQSSIALSDVLPSSLAEPLNRLSGLLNLKPEAYLMALLTQVASLLKCGTTTMLFPQTDYKCTPNYFGAIVSESSQKKSPILNAIIDNPMKPLRMNAKEEHEEALKEYQEEAAKWDAQKKEDRTGPRPKEPRQKIYSFDESTGEGIVYQVENHPEQGLLYVCDELAGLFKSANKYRGGRGSDEEDLLKFWNGKGATVLRASGLKASLEGLLLSIFGNIQPDVLAGFLKDCSDSNGKFARFDFIIQPLAAATLQEDAPRVDLTPMLTALYRKIDSLPPMEFELDPEARGYFVAFYNACEKQRVSESSQGMRAMLGKMPEKVGKLATVIHVIYTAQNDKHISLSIPKYAVQAAVKFVKYAAEQTRSLHTEIAERNSLAPNLAKILDLAKRKNGATLRELSKGFNHKNRPPMHLLKDWVAELQNMKLGTFVDGKFFVGTTGDQVGTNSRSPVPTVPSELKLLQQEDLSGPHNLFFESPQSPVSGDQWGPNGDQNGDSSNPYTASVITHFGDLGTKFTHPSETQKTEVEKPLTKKSPIIQKGDPVLVEPGCGLFYAGKTGVVVAIWSGQTPWQADVKIDGHSQPFCCEVTYLRKL